MWIARHAGLKGFDGRLGGPSRDGADVSGIAGTGADAETVVCRARKRARLAATRDGWRQRRAVVGTAARVGGFLYARDGWRLTCRVGGALEWRRSRARRELGLEGALLVTVPVPPEAEVGAALMTDTLDEALREAERTGVSGRELTPFLLSRMSWRSGGATLKANVALLENNARVAADIARALVALS